MQFPHRVSGDLSKSLEDTGCNQHMGFNTASLRALRCDLFPTLEASSQLASISTAPIILAAIPPGRPLRRRAMRVPKRGFPVMKDLVPSMGSRTQTLPKRQPKIRSKHQNCTSFLANRDRSPTCNANNSKSECCNHCQIVVGLASETAAKVVVAVVVAIVIAAAAAAGVVGR